MIKSGAPDDCLEVRSRYRGCLAGAVVGDCLGAPWEGQCWKGTLPLDQVTAEIAQLVGAAEREGAPTISYTDDSVLTLALARSLVACKGLDHAHVAKSLCEAYASNRDCGFSSSTGRVLTQLKAGGYSDLTSPAQQQFLGQGSCGNGGAMRVSPAALYGCGDEERMVQTALKCTKLTHTHISGVNGALLQALAVREALLTQPGRLAPLKFIDSLLDKMCQFETEFDPHPPDTSEEQTVSGSERVDIGLTTDRSSTSYRRTSEMLGGEGLVLQFTAGQPSCTSQLLQVRIMLAQPHLPSPHTVQMRLGHGVLACEAVPCAIYSFLTSESFQHLIPNAISLGGDTDTIASMAGAIGGAYWGLHAVPPSWLAACQGTSEALSLADSLYSISIA